MIKLNSNGVKRIVVCAANKYGDLIVCSARHYDRRMHNTMKYLDSHRIPADQEVQGFIDQFGTFMDREEAMQIVLGNNQKFNKVRNGGDTKELFSEGLY